MNRRAFVTGLGAMLGAPLAAAAQQARKTWRIGYLGDSSPSPTWPRFIRIPSSWRTAD
jgi:hypothetical protein